MPDITKKEQEKILRKRALALQQMLFKDENSHFNTYAVLEAGMSLNGSMSKLVSALDDYGAEAWQQLIGGWNSGNLAQVSTYLIELEEKQTNKQALEAGLTHFTDWLLRQPDLLRWGFFVRSTKTFETVFMYLKRFAVVQLENGNSAYFRFASPKIFPAFFSSLSQEERKEMSEILHEIYIPDHENKDNIFILTHNPSGYDLKKMSIAGHNPELEPSI